jgi:hypothetical protein
LQIVVLNCALLKGIVLIIVQVGFSAAAVEEFHATILIASVNKSNRKRGEHSQRMG